jgi:hypothetical protein
MGLFIYFLERLEILYLSTIADIVLVLQWQVLVIVVKVSPLVYNFTTNSSFTGSFEGAFFLFGKLYLSLTLFKVV